MTKLTSPRSADAEQVVHAGNKQNHPPSDALRGNLLSTAFVLPRRDEVHYPNHHPAGSHVGTRTPDLYRVKLGVLSTYNNLHDDGELLST
jgi:hypothetical protein